MFFPRCSTAFVTKLSVMRTVAGFIILLGLFVPEEGQGSECGGNLIASNTTKRQFQSPGYPNSYTDSLQCQWTIRSDVRTRIYFNITAIEVEHGSDCSYDSVTVYDGTTTSAPVLGKYCGSDPDNTVPSLSTSNVLLVVFETDSSVTKKGFQAVYKSGLICGGNLVANARRQIMHSPGYPTRYSHNALCRWIIRSSSGSVVYFNVTTIDIERHSTCDYDSLSVYGGPTTSSHHLGKYCGSNRTTIPSLFVSKVLQIFFITDGSATAKGFQAEYQIDCESLLRGTQGVIQAPSFPNRYTNDIHCTWKIEVKSGRHIQLTFEEFNIRGTPGHCSGSYLEVRNGRYSNSPPMGCNGQLTCKLCGNYVPPSLTSLSNHVWINFISDNSERSTKFKIAYHEISITCNGRLTLTGDKDDGMFMSPNYPSNYPHSIECIWIFIAPTTKLVQLDFKDFDIESGNGCPFDFLEVRDGETSSDPLIGRFCGNTISDTIRSSTSKLYVQFRTDGSGTGKGFRARYAIALCGGIFNSRYGVLQSPNFPSNYAINVVCTWYINGPFGHYINFTFESLDIQSSALCTRDFIEFRHKNGTGELLGKFCGTPSPGTIRFPDGDAFVRFVSDSSVTARGFRVRYEASLKDCGGNFVASNGTFTSPYYPNAYLYRRECVYKISVRLGRRIKLVVYDIAVGLSQLACSSQNSLSIYDGVLDDSPRILRLCGRNRNIAPIQSSSNTMKLVFTTGGSAINKGFSASYSSDNPAVCGGRITGPQPGVVQSPGYASGMYPNSIQCTWIVAAPNSTGWSIELDFTSFDLESSLTCRHDFIEVKDGSDGNQLVGRYCGSNATNTNLPWPLLILSPWPIHVRFRTDLSNTRRGFNLTYSFSECGGVLSDASGIITSPNYPSAYHPNVACVWVIQAPNGHKIQIQTLEFNVGLQISKDCHLDYVTVLNGGYPSSPSIGRFCGNVTNAIKLRSMNNRLRVEFNSDFLSAGGRFKIRYNIDNTGCGGVLHAANGHITSPNYPHHYPHNTQCIWDIIVVSGNHVNLTFNNPFAIDAEFSTCTYDYVEVSDYKNGEYTPIYRGCGHKLPPSQRSSDNRLRVKFRSDPWTNATGFSASWRTVCGFMTTVHSGVFSSPGYPNNYDHDIRCEYVITGDPTDFVTVEFDTFRLQESSDCVRDSLTLFDGTNETQPLIGRFCGYRRRFSVAATGSMLLVFFSDKSLSNTGFRATFRHTRCGGELRASDGTIEPYVATYHGSFVCAWTIIVKSDRAVDISLRVATNFENISTDCSNYIEVHDGVDQKAASLGRFCLPSVGHVRSSDHRVKVTFSSNSTVTLNSFSINFRSTLGLNQGCGGVLTETSGTIGFPPINQYEVFEGSLNCTWFVNVFDHAVPCLTFTSFNIVCHSRYVQIRDGNSSAAPLIGRYCGTTPPAPITASSNVIAVTLISNNIISRNVFNISYTSVGECPVKGIWSEWTPWSSCSKTCDNGEKTRSRVCTQPLHVGHPCVGDSTEWKTCQTILCSVGAKHTSVATTVGIVVGGIVAIIIIIVIIVALVIIYKRRNPKPAQTLSCTHTGISDTVDVAPSDSFEMCDPSNPSSANQAGAEVNYYENTAFYETSNHHSADAGIDNEHVYDRISVAK